MDAGNDVRGNFEVKDGACEPPRKIAKLDISGDNEADKESEVSPRCTFEGFKIDKVLNDNPQNKILFLQGRFDGSENKAVVLLEKTPFCTDNANHLLCKDTNLKETLQNDIYHTYDVYPDPKLNALKATVIYPATDKHVQKYIAQDVHLVEETAEDYEKITLPYLNQSQFSVQWVYNILEKKKESERILYEDCDPETGFILIPDMKWDLKDTSRLYLSAIVQHRALKSLRDLGPEHLPLLKNILMSGQKAIQDKYGVPPSKLRIYFHYQPSYYHLHVHFTHVKLEAPGSGVERAHLLTDVINNIKLLPDYYKLKPLMFTVKENDPLYNRFKEAGKL
ncbi:m7GpppX diphosphatase-like [Liolophura sinensis]|uniref:m7GpppX diphosphatase-like n=1 Tax=Liolophura sinensis TaxID=3198878 RepID=UPI0031591451